MEDQIRATTTNLSHLAAERTNLLRPLKDQNKDSPTTRYLLNEIERLSNQIEEVEDQQLSLKEKLAALRAQVIAPQDLAALYREIIPHLLGTDREKVRRYLQLTIKEVEVNKPQSSSRILEGTIKIKPWLVDAKEFDLSVLKGSSRTYPALLRR